MLLLTAGGERPGRGKRREVSEVSEVHEVHARGEDRPHKKTADISLCWYCVLLVD